MSEEHYCDRWYCVDRKPSTSPTTDPNYHWCRAHVPHAIQRSPGKVWDPLWFDPPRPPRMEPSSLEWLLNEYNERRLSLYTLMDIIGIPKAP